MRELRIKEAIQQRAKKQAEEYKENLIKEEKDKYDQTIAEYENTLIEHYKLEIRIKFMEAMLNTYPNKDISKEIKEIKEKNIILFKKVQDIQNSGILDKYDAIMEAIKSIS